MNDLIADIRILFKPLLAEVEGALDRREQQYPPLIEAGRMDAQAAADELRAWRAIVADWRQIVTGLNDRGTDATIDEKIAVLLDGIARYEAAIPRAIANEKDAVIRDCAEISDRRYLADRHGQAVARYIALCDSRDRLADLAIIYHSERPGARPWRGLWVGIDQYLDFHRTARADQAAPRKAA